MTTNQKETARSRQAVNKTSMSESSIHARVASPDITPESKEGSVSFAASVEADADRARRRQKWNVYSPVEFKARITELDSGGFLIDGLIPKRSLSIVVGDSGLGKSPLLYQAAMCVAHGIPFLGFPTVRARVLYLDYENGLQGVYGLTGQLAKHLGIGTIDHENLLPWNFNDAPLDWSSSKLEEMIGDLRPEWVVIDPLGGFDLTIEANPENVTRNCQRFRRNAQEFGPSFTGVHHIRKPSDIAQYNGPKLEEDAMTWMLRARGARQLINGSDVRLGIDAAEGGGAPNGNLVVAGFARLSGSIGPLLVERVFDDEGRPLGYRRMSGATLLSNPAQKEAFQDLPDTFTFTQAKQVYGKADQATTDFLKKCQSVGIVRHDARTYSKVKES